MFEKAAKILSEYCGRGEKIAVAVSGGKDSMCLLHFCLNCGAVKKDDVFVVNVEHGIRGLNSLRDSEFVKSYCDGAGVECRSFSVDIPAIAEMSGRSVETAAREERYKIFSSLVKSGACKYVLAAHHALDNAETVLMHLFRGSGIDGLKGMDILGRGYILRPLITTDKSEIDEYAEVNKVPFVTDETNSDGAYNRNFLRNEILPLVSSRWGGAVKAVNALGEEVKRLLALLDGLIDYSLVKTDGKVSEIDLHAFGNGALAPRYVIYALKAIGAERDVERRHIDLIVELCGKNTGSAVELPHGIRAEKTYGAVMIFKTERSEKNGSCVPFALRCTEFCGIKITAEKTDKAEFGSGALYLDLNKIPASAEIRFRRDGDRFRPYGGGEKKLKEYFIDKKIPKRLRDNIPLLCDGNRVLAVLGVEISDLVKIKKGSQVVKITLNK